MKRGLHLYVFYPILEDYTYGVGFALAHCEQEARELIIIQDSGLEHNDERAKKLVETYRAWQQRRAVSRITVNDEELNNISGKKHWDLGVSLRLWADVTDTVPVVYDDVMGFSIAGGS